MNAPNLRDQGLRRVSRLTGWLAAAAIVGVGAFAGLLARPHTSSAKVTTGGQSAGTSTNSTTRSGSAKSPSATVTRPTQPPVQSRQRGPAVSGGS